jgi:putative methyltransferase
MDNPSICAFSTYIWNECYNLELAKAIKQRFPSCLIQFGGPNVPNQENDYKQWRQAHPWIDTTIRYEGEVSFQNMLLDYLNGTVKKDYVTERMDHLDIPSPYLTGMFDSIIDQGGYTWAMTIETNRGCPFQCTFCDWGSLTYSKIKKFPLQKVLDEITWAGKHKIEFLFIADANFGVFPDRDLEIIEHLIATREHYGFPSMVATAWYKNSNEVILTLAEM